MCSILQLLPLKESSGTLEWPSELFMALEKLSQGRQVSAVSAGDSLLDYIVEMRHLVGMDDYGLPSGAAQGLTFFFEDFVPGDFARNFFSSLLPSIARLAQKLSTLLKEHFHGGQQESMVLRVLPAGQRGFVLMTQELAASILACSFLCLYPSKERPSLRLPYINFDRMFTSLLSGPSASHKLLCILHYFRRVCEKMPQGLISYERKVLWLNDMEIPDASFWTSSSMPLCQFMVLEDGTIESNELPALEVDFANKFLGGGVLTKGCLQEEIRFIINPELIAGMLFLPAMVDNEAIEIVGSERYSRYEGYASTFEHAGDFADAKPRDSWGRKTTHIIAMDALPHPGEQQFKPEFMLRELNKAFCGFLHQNGPKTGDIPGVATGNWGCGVFGGDHEVKSMLQWLACSEAGRPFLLYYTFNDTRTKKLQSIVDWILREKWSVMDLWNVLCDYGNRRKQVGTGFFDWLLPADDDVK